MHIIAIQLANSLSYTTFIINLLGLQEHLAIYRYSSSVKE
jgi:hypothetical protein